MKDYSYLSFLSILFKENLSQIISNKFSFFQKKIIHSEQEKILYMGELGFQKWGEKGRDGFEPRINF